MTATSSLASDVLPPIAQCLGRTEGPGPAWLSPLRSQASAWVSEHGFPTRKHEDWRYLPLKAILETPFRPGADEVDHQVMPRALGGPDSDLGGTRLVFVNGRLAPEWSRFGELPEGVLVTSLAAVVAEAAERLRPTWSRPYGHAFAALNAALASDGAFVQLPADSVVEDPIELVFWSDASDSPLLSIPRSVVLAGAGSRASVVETYAGADGGLYCTNAVTEIT
ncbi:MAG: Fe-S cluster assembly protein SufD, partial [Acidimicrobiales bacterium]